VPKSVAVIGQLALRVLRLRPLGAALRVELGPGLVVRGHVWLPGPGRVRIGRGVTLLGERAPIELRAYPGGEIVIEDGAVIEAGTSIEATLSVRVGARARIGPFCKIIDNHFHRTVGDRGERPDSVAIAIGEDAVVGPRAILLPGAELGAGARVGPATSLSLRLRAGSELSGRPGAGRPA
jgi:acetyltransferase-like isoleucine patch superfamily enzyme